MLFYCGLVTMQIEKLNCRVFINASAYDLKTQLGLQGTVDWLVHTAHVSDYFIICLQKLSAVVEALYLLSQCSL